MAKNQAKFKQHPEAELLLFEWHFPCASCKLSSKNNWRYSKECTKKQMSLFKFGYKINDNENESEIEK